MAVFRIERKGNYTTMSNYHLRDKNLSLKAKGLLSICLSLTDSWDYSINGLTAICKEGRDAVQNTVKELEQAGYIYREQRRNKNGKMSHSEYVIRELPFSESPLTENPFTVFLITEKPLTENPIQLITNKRNTDLINKRINNIICEKYGIYKNVILSEEDFKELKSEFPEDYMMRIESLSEYMASTGKSYKNHLATIRSWAKKERRYSVDNKYQFKEGESL